MMYPKLEKIKILHVAALDKTIWKFRLPLIEMLSKRGYEVWISCSPGTYLNQIREKGYKVKPIKIERKIISLSNFKSFFKLYWFMKSEKYRIVHTHTPIASALVRPAAKLAGIPIVIFTTGGFYFHENMNSLLKYFIILIEKFLAKFTDMILSPNREDVETALRQGIATKDKIIYGGFAGINLDKFNLENVKRIVDLSGFKEALIGNQTQKIVTYIGRLTWEKGCREFIEAAKKILNRNNNVKFLMVGMGPIMKSLISLSRKLKISENIIFTGWREDIPSILAITDIFILPSYREGMPNTVLEASAMKRPVITTNIRGCREAIKDGITGYLIPIKDSLSLAKYTLKLLRNENLMKRMGEMGRKWAERHFDQKKMVNQQVEIYEKLIEETCLPCSRKN